MLPPHALSLHQIISIEAICNEEQQVHIRSVRSTVLLQIIRHYRSRASTLSLRISQAYPYIPNVPIISCNGSETSRKMSYSSYSSGTPTWVERLEGIFFFAETPAPHTDRSTEKCRESQLHPPVFHIMSDRRGISNPPPHATLRRSIG